MSAPTGDVVDRLERLAAQAPVATADPGLLWRRGRRRQRRRTTSALVGIAAVGVLATALTPLMLARIDRPVASASSQLVLPVVLRSPDGWEPAFPPTPGRLSAVGVGQRSGWFSSSPSLWGVSAVTGESRWLGLADMVSTARTPPQLSADGRRLAYWMTGPTSGEPVVGGGAAMRGGVEQDDPVVGVAVMDLETGEVARWEVESEHGLSVQALVWAGDVLWWQGGPVVPLAGGSSSTDVRTHVWDLDTDGRTELGGRDERASVYLAQPGHAPGGFVTLPRSFQLQQVRAAQEPEDLRVELPAGTPTSAGLIDPEVATDGDRVAALMLPSAPEYDYGADKDLLVGTRADGVITLEPVGDIRAQAVLGWRSPTEVVVSSWTGTDGDRVVTSQRAWVVDVTTGARTDLLDVEGSGPDSVAADAWAGDVVAAHAAPFAPDPRVVGAGAVVVLVLGLSLWRSVRRRRGHP